MSHITISIQNQFLIRYTWRNYFAFFRAYGLAGVCQLAIGDPGPSLGHGHLVSLRWFSDDESASPAWETEVEANDFSAHYLPSLEHYANRIETLFRLFGFTDSSE